MYPEALTFLKSKHEREIFNISNRIEEITQVELAKISLDIRSLSHHRTKSLLEYNTDRKTNLRNSLIEPNPDKKSNIKNKALKSYHRRNFSEKILH